MTHLGAPVPPSAETLSFAAQAREVHWNLSRADLVAWSLRLDEGELSAEDAKLMMSEWYNGYRFALRVRGRVYNPTLVFYFLLNLLLIFYS